MVHNKNANKLQTSLVDKLMPVMTPPQPSVTPKLDSPKFGFNDYAERLNGRAAMIGFVLMLAIEYLTGEGILSWLGLK
jgi:hypothetical protein